MNVGGRPDKGDVDDLTKEFIAESQEGLERMEICLTELEKRPNELELVAEIFRIAHTIKGTTGFLDLDGWRTWRTRAKICWEHCATRRFL
jgi:chemotaxis protein histidine kinase CheA